MPKRVETKKLMQLTRDFARPTHKTCALTFLTRVFYAARIVCYKDVIEICEEVANPCFSKEELIYVWDYLITEGFITAVEIIAPYNGTVYVCPHLGIGADYRHRKRLCKDCRREFTSKVSGKSVSFKIGQMLTLYPEEVRAALGEPVEWPDELDL